MFIQYKFPRTAKVIKDFFGKFDEQNTKEFDDLYSDDNPIQYDGQSIIDEIKQRDNSLALKNDLNYVVNEINRKIGICKYVLYKGTSIVCLSPKYVCDLISVINYLSDKGFEAYLDDDKKHIVIKINDELLNQEVK